MADKKRATRPAVQETPAGGPPWILIIGVLVVAAGAFAMFWPGSASEPAVGAEAAVADAGGSAAGASAQGASTAEPGLPERPPAPPTPERRTPAPAPDAPMPPLPAMGGMPRSPEVIRDAYLFAAQRPDVLEYVPCYCGCETAGHSGNADCFVSARNADGSVRSWETHGMACTICIDVARDAMQLTRSGATVPDVRAAVEAKYARFPQQTPTPAPPAN